MSRANPIVTSADASDATRAAQPADTLALAVAAAEAAYAKGDYLDGDEVDAELAKWVAEG